MIGYVTLGSNNISVAAGFYDALLKEIGAARVMEAETFVAWGRGNESPVLSVIKPDDGNAATIGNGVMVALRAESTESVDALHTKALSLGGANEGAPGLRSGGFYCAYFRDLDGNKLNFYYHP